MDVIALVFLIAGKVANVKGLMTGRHSEQL